MTAQPIEHHAPLPRIPYTVKGIRSFLPAEQQAVFDAERDDLDLGDLAAVGRFRDKWWGAAMVATNPSIQADLDALERGELEFFPSPFAR
jgi:hypothetical protein